MSNISFIRDLSCILYGQGCTSPTNLPSYIDTDACLCALVTSRSTLPNNGEVTELWRCIGNSSANIGLGSHGKWYNTVLPSEDLSGINKPEDWAENPPDLSQTYVLEKEKNSTVYNILGPGGSSSLIGADVNCTGMNDTVFSELYYARGEEFAISTSSAASLCTPTSVTEPQRSYTENKRAISSEDGDFLSGTNLGAVIRASTPIASSSSDSQSVLARPFTLKLVLGFIMIVVWLVALVN